MIKINLWPLGYKAAFAIRDDDVSFFTDPAILKNLYGEIWNRFPISFSVIPYHKSITGSARVTRNIPPEFRESRRVYNIDANIDLIKFLQKIVKEGKADISLHGCTHESIDGKFEFYSNNYFKLKKRVKRGRALLQNIFNKKVKVFVPPHNTLSRAGASAVINEAMDIARTGSYAQIFKTVIDRHNLPILMKLFLKNPIIFFKSPLTPRLIFFRGHIDMQQSYMLSSDMIRYNTLNEMKSRFFETISREDLFYMTVHYWDFYKNWNQLNTEMLSIFNDFLDFIEDKNVWKTTLEKVAEWLDRLRSINISKEGCNLKIRSTKNINGLTITTNGDKIIYNGPLEEVSLNKYILDLKKTEDILIPLE